MKSTTHKSIFRGVKYSLRISTYGTLGLEEYFVTDNNGKYVEGPLREKIIKHFYRSKK